MDCVIEGRGVKAFGKAIQALSRIGDELLLDPMEKGLAVRTVNAAHSAYSCFLFSPLFFQCYTLGPRPAQDSGAFKCKLLMKSVLPLFRGLASFERNVTRCQISSNIPGDRVVFQFFCRHGITKTYNLCFQESEALQSVFPLHLCPNVLKAQARLLGGIVMHFPVSQEEVTLSINPLSVNLRSYYEEGCDHMKMMCTETSLHPNEFDYFQVGVDSDITFCLKELRGLVSFAESYRLPVSVHFGAAGKPVCFSVEDMVLEASLVLATLIDSDSRGPSQATAAPSPTAPRCGDAAGLPEGSCEADSRHLQGFPAVVEVVASSQGSPMVNPSALMRLLTGAKHSDSLNIPDKGRASAVTTPAPSKICSLLFGALSQELDEDGCVSMLPVLACYSDVEEDVEEDITRSPSL